MYSIIDNLPIDFNFFTKTKSELKLYEQWFYDNKEFRLKELLDLVTSTQGYENWKADFSKKSLEDLGKWLKESVEIEKLTEEEYAKRKSSIPDYIDIEDWDLTIKTRSILVDVGIYFGEVFIHNNKGLAWKQYFSKRKNDVDQGHMIIQFGKKREDLNPIWIMFILGLGLANGTRNENRLKELYEIWEEL